MKTMTLLPALALGLGLGLAPAQLLAANADDPHQNVDKRNDAGNSTGNSQVEGLNSQQLDANQQPPANPGGTASSPPATASSPQK